MVVLNERRKEPRGDTRRQEPRWLVNRNVQIHFRMRGEDGKRTPAILMGYTYDISPTGVSILLPALDCHVQDLFDLEEPISVVLSTSPRTVAVKAAPVHCEVGKRTMPVESAFLGMRIIEQDNGYQNYIERLGEPE